MITEDYVSANVAKLLKEKGFEILTDKVYDNQNKLDYQCAICFVEERLPYISAPTLQMAMKWLREEKNIILDICPNLDLDCTCIGTYCRIVYKDNERVTLDADYDDFATYEEACEAAIRYALENLIDY